MNDELIVLRKELDQLHGHIATLDQENRQLNARNARLEDEVKALEDLLKNK